MNGFVVILIPLIAFAIAAALTYQLSGAESRLGLLDHPNSRSLHTQPIPRTGGLAVLGSILISGAGLGFTLPAARSPSLVLLIGLTPLAVVSFLDDWISVAAKWRIFIHLLVAASLLVAGFAPDRLELPGWTGSFPRGFALPLTLLFTVWMINLYNFMDGMDGFASGMAVIGFLTLAWLGRADSAFTVISLIVAAASAGFLIHNFPPATIFLGDTGSTLLGFLAAACSLWGSKAGLFPFWVALLVFSPFIVDASVTLLRRLWRGEKIWEAHRSHCYQRLVLLGWGHRRTVLVEYALMLACAGSALLAVWLSPAGQVALAVAWTLVYGLLIWRVERLR